jgi:hypothetical protein
MGLNLQTGRQCDNGEDTRKPTIALKNMETTIGVIANWGLQSSVTDTWATSSYRHKTALHRAPSVV